MGGDISETLQKACLTPHHPQLKLVVQPQVLLIESYQQQYDLYKHLCACAPYFAPVSTVLMKRSPYPFPSLSIYLPTK